MDIISHGFWAATVYKAANKNNNQSRLRQKSNFLLFVFWSILPDVVSFGLLFLWFAIIIISSGFDFSILPHHMRTIDANEPPALMGFTPIFRVTSILYSASHSIIIFSAIFGLFFLLIKSPPWTMLGWFFHILIDIPTHSYQFYPTPFLWPVSGWYFHGISWGAPWFLILNYSVMVLVYYFFWRKKKKSVSQEEKTAK